MYPDASGKNRKSQDASRSDIAQLEQAGFEVRANASNPAVKDRVAAVNKALESGRLRVNEQACPVTARCLACDVQTAWPCPVRVWPVCLRPTLPCLKGGVFHLLATLAG